MDAGHLQFAVVFVMEIEIGFHATERASHVVHDLIDEFVQIEDGSDLPRPLLQFEEMLYLLQREGTELAGIRDDGSRDCSHGTGSLTNVSRESNRYHVYDARP
jgi:hypothetical protein